RGYRVDALSRSQAGAERLRELGANPVVAQATDPSSLAEHFENADIVVSALGITRQRDGLTYEDVDYRANMNLLRAAEQAGVRQFVYVSAFEGEALAHTALLSAKEKFVRELKDSPIEGLVVRPTGFFSDMEQFTMMARRGRVWVFGQGDQLLNPISGEDLAEAIADAIDDPRHGNAEGIREDELPIGGPEVFTMRQIANLAFEAVDGTPRITSIPMWVVGLAERVLPRVTPLSFYGPIQMFLAASHLSMVAPIYGSRRLADHYGQVAAESSDSTARLA
ncbi:MAG: hypothetical protein ACI8Y4_005019, partial [Candidatus Poriferisodalaceae bacterium]